LRKILKNVPWTKMESTISPSLSLFMLKMYMADPNMKINMTRITKNG